MVAERPLALGATGAALRRRPRRSRCRSAAVGVCFTYRSSAENKELIVFLQSPACKGEHREGETSSPAGPITSFPPFLTRVRSARSPSTTYLHLYLYVCMQGGGEHRERLRATAP